MNHIGSIASFIVISGGQTGVDRGALDAALSLAVPCGGWCPAGRKAEDGPIPERYPLKELPGADYIERTRKNQVFIGLPWSARTRYDHAVDYLRTRSPLSSVIVGRNDRQDAEDLFQVIQDRISASSFGVFDASGGNANVSLEYGFAEAIDLPRSLYLSTHGAGSRVTRDAPIISDLAGKRRNQYKQEGRLKALLLEFSGTHAYTIRFERFLSTKFKRKDKGEKKRRRALALKVIHRLDGVLEVRRADVIHQLQADVARYSGDEVDQMLKLLHSAKLIQSQQGPHARVQIA